MERKILNYLLYLITIQEKTLMKELNRISMENGCTHVNLSYIGSTGSSKTWKYEFYYGLPEYSKIKEFGEITIGKK